MSTDQNLLQQGLWPFLEIKSIQTKSNRNCGDAKLYRKATRCPPSTVAAGSREATQYLRNQQAFLSLPASPWERQPGLSPAEMELDSRDSCLKAEELKRPATSSSCTWGVGGRLLQLPDLPLAEGVTPAGWGLQCPGSNPQTHLLLLMSDYTWTHERKIPSHCRIPEQPRPGEGNPVSRATSSSQVS